MKTEIMVGIITNSGMGSYWKSPKQNFAEAVIEEARTNDLFQLEKEKKYIEIIEQEEGNPENIIRSVKIRNWEQLVMVKSARNGKADHYRSYHVSQIVDAIRECNNCAKWYHLDYIVEIFDAEEMGNTEIYRKEAE